MIQPMMLRQEVLRWYDARVRPLPWRGQTDPYKIWISEIMLQQTRAEAVIPYYEAFVRDYPCVRALAEADLQDVLKHWEGLGYYSRARNLHSAAALVTNQMSCEFPKEAIGLRRLAGVGEYTAGMIASIAYGEAAPAIDGNQIRVLSRIFWVDEPARTASGMGRIREHARALLDPLRPGDFNQALMDIGSSLCKPKNPRCEDCPAAAWCEARRRGERERLPILPEKAQKRVERRGVAVVIADGRALVCRRDGKLLGGLWQFPNFLNADSQGAILACARELGLDAKCVKRLDEVEHVFTHLIWKQAGFLLRAGRLDVEGYRWADKLELAALPMPTAMARYRQQALEAME